jgi:hypothetical protein
MAESQLTFDREIKCHYKLRRSQLFSNINRPKWPLEHGGEVQATTHRLALM